MSPSIDEEERHSKEIKASLSNIKVSEHNTTPILNASNSVQSPNVSFGSASDSGANAKEKPLKWKKVRFYEESNNSFSEKWCKVPSDEVDYTSLKNSYDTTGTS